MQKIKNWYKKYKYEIVMYTFYGTHAVVGIIAVFASILVIAHAFSNPELTSTQIIIYSFKNCWWAYLSVIAIAIIDNIFLKKK